MLRIDFTYAKKQDAAPVFRFSMQSEPTSYDPGLALNPISSYVLNALYRPLLKWQSGKLTSGGAKSCYQLSAKHYRCQLDSDWRWSDGEVVTASQIARGFVRLKNITSPRLADLASIKEVKAKGNYQLDFILHEPDGDFLFRLLDPALGPDRGFAFDGRITYGDYFLKNKKAGQLIELKSTATSRPDVEILFVDSNSTELNLYQSGQLNFLRMLTTESIHLYKNTKQLFFRPLHRIDYIGFGPELESQENLRKNLIYSLKEHYISFVKIFSALGRPGCFGLDKNIFQDEICIADRKYKAYDEKEIKALPKLKLVFATQGGDDIIRTMTFFQSGWKKNLNLDVRLEASELAVFTAQLKSSPPTLFRRGVSLERPTCLAALEIFQSQSPDNFIGFKSHKFDKLLNRLKMVSSPTIKAQLCRDGLNQLLLTHRIIPMGAIHIAMLSDQKFIGFSINELGQIDLSGLKANRL